MVFHQKVIHSPARGIPEILIGSQNIRSISKLSAFPLIDRSITTPAFAIKRGFLKVIRTICTMRAGLVCSALAERGRVVARELGDAARANADASAKDAQEFIRACMAVLERLILTITNAE
jgi:hypothetical protein